MECKRILNEVVQMNLEFHPEYNGWLSNHLSMTCFALYYMHEDSNLAGERIKLLAENYSKKLDRHRQSKTLIDLSRLDDEELLQFLGRIDFFDTWYSFFEKKIQEEDPIEVTINWLKILSNGIAAAGGHGFLRVYYCLISRNILTEDLFKRELAFSLAYFASRHLNLDSRKTPLSEGYSIVRAINSQIDITQKTKELLKDSHLITTRHKICSWDPNYKDLIEKIDLDYTMNDVLTELSKQSLSKVGFGLLHNLSVGQAIVDLLDRYPNLECSNLKQGFVDFVIAEYFVRSVNSVSGIKNITVTPFDLTDVMNLFENVSDVHSIKSAYSLVYLYNKFNDDVYLNSAIHYMRYYN